MFLYEVINKFILVKLNGTDDVMYQHQTLTIHTNKFVLEKGKFVQKGKTYLFLINALIVHI